jgi:hypothetical protein
MIKIHISLIIDNFQVHEIAVAPLSVEVWVPIRMSVTILVVYALKQFQVTMEVNLME